MALGLFILIAITSASYVFADNLSVGISVNPTYVNPKQDVNVSVEVISNYSIDYVVAEITFPNNSKLNSTMSTDSSLTIGVVDDPYNLTSLSYNVSIDCHDFTDDSECEVNGSQTDGSCANVIFNDEPGGSTELDIGISLCVNESHDAYYVNFTRWSYDTSHEVGAKYCINSIFGVNECSGWVLNSTAAGYGKNHTKIPPGILYTKSFLDTFRNGWYNIRVYALDLLGNLNSSETSSFYVNDTVYPVVYLGGPANGTSYDDGFVFFEYNVTDINSSVANCSLLINGGINITDMSISKSTSQFFGLSHIADGTYTWSIQCIDDTEDAHTNTSETRTFFTTDTTPPSLYLKYPLDDANDTDGEVIFKYYVSEYAYDIANCSLIINGAINQTDTTIDQSIRQNFTLSELGTDDYNWSIECIDTSPSINKGNSSTYTLSIEIETTPPNIYLMSPASGSSDSDGNINFTFNSTDTNTASGISSCKFIFNNNLNQSNSSIIESYPRIFSLYGLSNGSYSWSINCTDDFGNEGSSATWIVDVSQDLSGPTLVLESPANAFTETSNSTVEFYYNVTDAANISYCGLIIDGVLNKTNQTGVLKGTASQVITQTLPDGDFSWSVNCTDSSDNHNIGSSAVRNITIDTKPIVTLNTPDNYTDTDGDVSFNFTVTDNIGLRYCDLFTDINGSWLVYMTNTFVQPNYSLYFPIDDIADNTIFNWNIECYDSDGYVAWSRANRTMIINNTPPILSAIPNITWSEDNYTSINLSLYFTDIDNDSLSYNYTSVDYTSVSIVDGVAVLTSEKNWFGTENITFIASDGIESTSSNKVVLTVNEMGDTAPKVVTSTPVDGFNDTDGYVFFNCNVSDDIALVNVSLYTDLGGWKVNQTITTSGTESVVVFNITGLSDTSFKWNCLVLDNASKSSWSTNKTANVNITVDLEQDVLGWIVNNVNHSRYVLLSFGGYINETLTLGNLSIIEADGEPYYSKNMSSASQFVHNNITYVSQKINITPINIFDSNFTVGNKAGLNFSITYSYKGKSYETKKNVTIEILNSTRWG